MQDRENVIEVENLTQDYGHNRGVFDVSFNIKKGEVFGFLGPNGAGKSTTIRHLMGFSKPQSGEISAFFMPPNLNFPRLPLQPFLYTKNLGISIICIFISA